MKLSLSTFIAVIIFPFAIWAQSAQDEQLAQQFLERQEYEKAIPYFDKLYSSNPGTFYQPYFRCLLVTKDLKKAEKVVKKQIKNFPEALQYLVDLGRVYMADSNAQKANEQFSKACKLQTGDLSQTLQFGKALFNIKEYDWAEKVYYNARRLHPHAYPYFYELADVYKAKGDMRAMINQYLDAVEYKGTELLSVQTQLQNSLGYDDEKGGFNNPILKQELLKRLQHSDNEALTEFLIFILLQQKDFEASFIQVRALDKRKKEDGFRLMELGKLCLNNEDYETAQKCFDYVKEKGKDGFNYQQACTESANAQYENITHQNNISPSELLSLEGKLNATLSDFGYNNSTIPVVRRLAKLEGFYLDRPEDAIVLINTVLAGEAFDKMEIAELKLDLGDLLLLTNEIWEASLTYSQVEKAFKYEPVGQEAKLRNARVAYYAGDFKWAKSQLDVLKGATSKLTANDAMDLSLVISDALAIDTNAEPLRMLASAELLVLQHKTDQALARMDSVNLLFDNHSVADDIYFRKGKIFESRGNYPAAIESYRRVAEVYGDEVYGDDALFAIAGIYQDKLNDSEKAKTTLQDFLTKYPGSVYSVEARKRLRKLRGDVVN